MKKWYPRKILIRFGRWYFLVSPVVAEICKWVRHCSLTPPAGVRGNLGSKCVSLTPNAWDLTGLDFTGLTGWCQTIRQIMDLAHESLTNSHSEPSHELGKWKFWWHMQVKNWPDAITRIRLWWNVHACIIKPPSLWPHFHGSVVPEGLAEIICVSAHDLISLPFLPLPSSVFPSRFKVI